MNMGQTAVEMVRKSSLDWKQQKLAAISKFIDEDIEDVLHRMIMRLFLYSPYDVDGIAYLAGEPRETILQVIEKEGGCLERRFGWALNSLKHYCMGY